MNMGNNIQSVEQDNAVSSKSHTLTQIDSVLEKFRYLRNEIDTITLESCEYNFNTPKQTYNILMRIVERMDMCYED